jgi:hypothetical protein
MRQVTIMVPIDQVFPSCVTKLSSRAWLWGMTQKIATFGQHSARRDLSIGLSSASHSALPGQSFQAVHGYGQRINQR